MTYIIITTVKNIRYRKEHAVEKGDMGKRIQSLLDDRNISRKEFAAMTGLTEAAISRYCAGMREPKSITLANIANALNVSVDELLGTPCEDPAILDDAMRLVARSTKNITTEDKRMLINALLELSE